MQLENVFCIYVSIYAFQRKIVYIYYFFLPCYVEISSANRYWAIFKYKIYLFIAYTVFFFKDFYLKD